MRLSYQTNRREHGQAAEQRAEHARAQPGRAVAALHDPVDQQHQAEDGAEHADVVDPARGGVAGLRHQEERGDQADGGDRDVDQEDRAPPEVGEQQAAEDRADRDADADGGGPDADGPGPLLRLEDVGDDRQRLRHHRRAAQAHRRAGRDQLVGRVRVGGQQRAEAEQGEADHEHALAADAVADHPEGEQQAGEDERVGVDRPLELGLAGAEAAGRAGDGLERDVENGVVDDDGEQPDDEHAEDDPSPALDH